MVAVEIDAAAMIAVCFHGISTSKTKPDSSTSTTCSTYHSIGKPIRMPSAVPKTPMQHRFRQHAPQHLARRRADREQEAQFALALEHRDQQRRHHAERRHDADHDLLQVREQVDAADQFGEELAQRIAVGDEKPLARRVAFERGRRSVPAVARLQEDVAHVDQVVAEEFGVALRGP